MYEKFATGSTVRGDNPTLYARKKLSGLFEKFPKVQLEKKRGDSAPGCRASKLLDFRPLLHLFLEAVSLRPGTCWLFIDFIIFYFIIFYFFSERAARAGGGDALPDFFFFFFPCSADHERDWPPCKVVFFRVGNQCAECEKQQQQTTTNNNNNFACTFI